MKKNMQRAMDRLDIDKGIRYIIRQLWKHNYRTAFSCQGGVGHADEAHVTYFFNSGDGWFEKKSFEYGFEIMPRNKCCSSNEKEGYQYCSRCGAGLNGHVAYFKPRF
ncbi:MAG: hypothetical protein Q7S27_03450 [Nanoarchaeota archaeon]|nr:hypothetical protein [Nanoarchaeota archaeon]